MPPEAQTVALASVIVAGVVGVLTPIAVVESARRRQRDQLRHDRAMRDLDDLRVVLDQGYDAAEAALHAFADARDATRRHIGGTVTPMLSEVTPESLASWTPEQHERYGEQLEQLTDGIADVIAPLVERLGERMAEVAAFSRRLGVRIGPDRPVTKDLVAVLDALESMLDAIRAQPEMLHGTERGKELEADATEARSRGRVALASYALHARQLVGARLED